MLPRAGSSGASHGLASSENSPQSSPAERCDDRPYLSCRGSRNSSSAPHTPPLIAEGSVVTLARVLYAHAPAGGRSRRRNGKRNRGNPRAHRNCQHHRTSNRNRRGSLPGGKESNSARTHRPISVRRVERTSVNSNWNLRLGISRSTNRSFLVAGGRCRAGNDDDSAAHAHDRGDAARGSHVTSR